jgi:hypothetical protein
MPVRNFCANARVRVARSARSRWSDESGNPNEFV